jgi:hypothetical protein
MAIHKLVFDATDADTLAASANVGAFLRSADGTLLTHTDVGGKMALDVRVAEGINVEVDLTFAEDSVDVSGSVVALDAGTLAALENITVSATDLDIRNLSAASDSVASWLSDGTGNAISSTSGSLNVAVTNAVNTNDAALANAALSTVPETVGLTAAQIVDGADELASRKYLYLYNNGNRTAYLGASGVTTASGFPVPPGSILEARIGAAVDVYMIADAAAQNIRTLQLS